MKMMSTQAMFMTFHAGQHENNRLSDAAWTLGRVTG